ncbi:MAG: AAA family ATPase [Thermoanaerobaculum sp.]|nr:AAA family ATPase [Thermoanaerobaculum sp.]
MYEAFYALAQPPFSLTPDPRFLFFSHQHREAFDHILYAVHRGEGFVQITGEVGTGKTTLCRAVLANLPESCRTALIFNPMVTGLQLLRAILKELGHEVRGSDRSRLLDRLNQFLLEQARQGHQVVLFIDEAQDLGEQLLEEIRLLSNLETDDRKLLLIVLLGQPELKIKLASHQLRQLAQRITLRYHLRGLRRGETKSYIQHRLAVAGANGRPTFSPLALWAIHAASKGIPRVVNTICDKTLLAGYVEGTDHLRLRHVKRALTALRGPA